MGVYGNMKWEVAIRKIKMNYFKYSLLPGGLVTGGVTVGRVEGGTLVRGGSVFGGRGVWGPGGVSSTVGKGGEDPNGENGCQTRSDFTLAEMSTFDVQLMFGAI